MNSEDIKMIDKKIKQIYYLSIALFIIGLIFLVTIVMSYVSLFLIPIGLYGMVKYKSFNGKNRTYVYYLIIAVSLSTLIGSSWYIIILISYGFEYFFWNLHWLLLFIFSLICFVFSIYKSICERRIKLS
ncbi:MAG: hypothetical protein ACFE8L_14330 [Candidatus Hodarchaeota archaeon]